MGPSPPQSRLAQSSSGVPQVDEAPDVMARKMDEARIAQSANWSGLVWSSLAVVGMSSMAGLGRVGDQKITTSCQKPGSFHMLSGECPCQLARAVSHPASVSIQGALLLITQLQSYNCVRVISECTKLAFH